MNEDSDGPPSNHPTWAPAGKSGHYCIAERWCPCGHMTKSHNHATTRTDGKRGRVTLDAIEGNDDGSR